MTLEHGSRMRWVAYSLILRAACGCVIAGAGLLNLSAVSAGEPAAISASTARQPLDLNRLVAEAVKSGKSELQLSPVSYEVDSVSLKNLKKFTIDGKGATLFFPPEKHAFEILGCDELTLRNFTVDYTRFSFTQGVVTAVNAADNTVDIRLHEGYPEVKPGIKELPGKTLPLHLHIFDSKTRTWKDGGPDLYTNRHQDLGGRVTRFFLEFDGLQQYIQPGDLIAVDWRNISGITVRGGTANLLMENVTIFTAPSIAILGRFCRGGHVYRNVRIVRGPKPEGATEDRLLSSCADAFNYAYCTEGPQIIGCEFAYMGDDSVNLHGSPFAVFKVENPLSILVMRPHNREEFDVVFTPGAQIRLLKPGNYGIAATSTAKDLVYVGGTPAKPQEGAEEFLTRMQLKPNNGKSSMTSHTVFRIGLNAPLEGLTSGMFVDIPAMNNRKYLIKDNYFHDHRARGLRIMAGDGVIEGNRLERIAQAAISIGAEYAYWREAGWVENVVIRNNTIKDVCRSWNATGSGAYALGAICTFIRNDNGVTPFYPGHRNLTITGNTIDGSRNAGIHLYAVDGAQVTGNTIRNVCRGDLEGKLDQAGKDYGMKVTVPIEVLDSAKNVRITDNRLE